jgi:RNA polymerase sigma factor (sigma-70 family)
MATDEQLIQQIREGKSEAYGQLFGKYYRQTYSVCFAILHNSHDAEEVTNDTFVHAYLKLDQLRKPDKFFVWLRKIAQNRSKNFLRDKPKDTIPLDLVCAQTTEQIAPDALLLRQELINAIMEAIESLPPKDREVIRAHIDGLNHSEISEQLGISIEASKSRLYRVRKKIIRYVRDLLNAIVFLPKISSRYSVFRFAQPFKKIVSGGIEAMKIGTSAGITTGITTTTQSLMFSVILHIVLFIVLSFSLPYKFHPDRQKVDVYLEVSLLSSAEVQQPVPRLSKAKSAISKKSFLPIQKESPSIVLARQDATPPKVVKTTPDFSEEIPTDTKEIRIVFNERMTGTDISYSLLPIGNMRWDEDGKTLVIPITENLEPSKTYTLILNSGGKYFTDLAENQLEECTLIFTTKDAPEPKSFDKAVIESGEKREVADVGAHKLLEKATYTVAITADEPRVANVCCVLTMKEDSDEAILLYMNNNGASDLPNGYAHYLRDITASDAEGNKLPIEELGDARWAIKPGDKSPVMLKYKALLKHDERDWQFGPGEVPYTEEDCIFWTGRALFIVGEVSDIELRFDVPDGWYVSTPWKPELRVVTECENRSAKTLFSYSFAVKDQDDLTESFILAGTHLQLMAKSSDTEILLAIGGSFKESATVIQSTVEGFLKAYTSIFDGAPESRMLFVANPNPFVKKGWMHTGVFGRSLNLLRGGALDVASRYHWTPFIGRELFHVWNGQAISHSGQEDWFSEGFTNYYSELIHARLGWTKESDFLKRMERACRLYLSNQGQLSIRDAGNSKLHDLVYEGGSLIGIALDLQIRKLTDNKKSLDDVMKQMYQQFGLTGKKYTMQDVIEIVNEITGENFEEFFGKYVSGTERLPLEEYFSYAGLDVQVKLGEELPSRGHVIHTLHINSLTQTNEGLIIHRSQKYGYQDEDNLIAMNGVPVKTFDDMRKAAKGLPSNEVKGWKPGNKVELTILRKGEKVTTSVLGGTSEELRTERDVTVTITKRKDITDSQQAILLGILRK